MRIEVLAQRRLDPAKPLWHMHLVDNCTGEDGVTRQALVIRIHHCIADGIALIGVFMSLFDNSPTATEHTPPPRAAAASARASWSPGTCRS